MFFVSRLVVELLSPLVLGCGLLGLGLFFAIFRKQRPALFCFLCSLVILVLSGYGLVGRQKLRDLEARYLPLSEAQVTSELRNTVRYIVVLGSGHVSDPRLPANSQIGGASLYRLVEGIRIRRLLPESKIVLTGGIGYDPVPNARVVAQVAEILGVPSADVLLYDTPRDTAQEAEQLGPLLREQSFILVTSAAHMPRAMEIFQAQGMNPLASPSDYWLKQHVNPPVGELFPSAGNLEITKRLLYEGVAALWAHLRRYSALSQS